MCRRAKCNLGPFRVTAERVGADEASTGNERSRNDRKAKDRLHAMLSFRCERRGLRRSMTRKWDRSGRRKEAFTASLMSVRVMRIDVITVLRFATAQRPEVTMKLQHFRSWADHLAATLEVF